MGRTWNWFMGTVRQFVKFVLIVALLGAAGYGSWLAIKKFVLKTQQKTKGAAQSFKQADKNLKLLIPRDASTASGAGISVRVSSNGAKRIMAEETGKNE